MKHCTSLPDKALFRPDEVAEIFGVTRQTVYIWFREGKIIGAKVGRKTLCFERSEIVRLIRRDT